MEDGLAIFVWSRYESGERFGRYQTKKTLHKLNKPWFSQ
jgi:hypothetical protein